MIAQQFVDELAQESQTTRRFLERIPADKLTWKPHEKSMSVGQLGLHIALTFGGVAEMVQMDEFPLPTFDKENPQPASVEEILSTFDEGLAKLTATLSKLSDEELGKTWSVVADGEAVMAVPKAGMLRMIPCNHIYHHRGQLGVYLRLLGCSVPSSYGPSGDELPDFLAEKATT